MIDGLGRTLDYLRISITDRCNLRCRYCMPEEGVSKLGHTEILSFDEIVRIVRIMTGLGVRRVRLTGGEPLVRRGVETLAAEIKKLGVEFLGLTTNGVALEQLGPALKAAGVDGLNISLDSTDEARYEFFTRRNELARAMTGLHTALDLGFKSVKVNAVLSPLSLESDWLGVIELARDLPVDTRLIEWMPISEEASAKALTADEALSVTAARFGPLTPMTHDRDEGPAQYYSINGFKGRVGVIPAMSHRFCSECNRLRITPTGDLKLCLFYDQGIALKPLLRGGADDDEIAAAIVEAIKNKPAGHQGLRLRAERENAELIGHPCGMWGIGG